MAMVEASVWAPPALAAQEERIIDAGLRCVARWGVAKTTLDDVARESGYSRATVYRFFPGGKDGLIDAIVAAELGRFFAGLGEKLDDTADLEALLVVAITESARAIAEHRALQYVIAHEPEILLPRISFRQMGDVLAVLATYAAPYLARHLAEGLDPQRAAEWVARIVLSYTFCPADHVVLGDPESVRSLVQTFVLPGLVPAQ